MEPIVFDYMKALNQASQLDFVATELKKIAVQQLNAIIEAVGDSWQGAGAEDFLSHCEQTKLQIIAAADATKNTADGIRKASLRIKGKQK